MMYNDLLQATTEGSVLFALINLIPWLLASGTIIYITNTLFRTSQYQEELTTITTRLEQLEQRAISKEDYNYLMSSATKQNSMNLQ